jgi:serine phosphatase RsbU (regulator of sigma subunit)/pSer/pThr/pTyr-binding forkhead associated (FHA) protein
MRLVIPSAGSVKYELIVRTPDGKSRTVPLDDEPVALGRATSNTLCYPDDVGLSRQHMVFEKTGKIWLVRDLNSKNGTFVHGNRLAAAHVLRPGDRISAGHLNIEFVAVSASSGDAQPSTVVFVDSDVVAAVTTTVATSLEGLMGPEQGDPTKTRVFTGNPQVRALIRAGQELVGNLKLEELFQVIMDLSLEAVGAGRGVLMTVEADELQVRAARGQGFQISSLVRDSVIRDGKSMLVLDAQSDTAFRERQSIVAQNVRSMLAVPLQSKERVIGLIYLDSPNLIRPFTRDDLNLLTVMANVAAMRIEHARLAEVEQAERMLAKDLDQAAKIQRGLLPNEAPQVPGYDIAGHTAACRTVGGDYYDFITFPDGRFALLVGDVAGKGMAAALMMSSLQARVQVLFETPGDLAQKVGRLNKAVAANCPDNRFITFFICVIDPGTGEVTYSNAGHNPPLVVRRNGNLERLNEGGIVLGIVPVFPYQQGSTVLDPGDVLAMYSDGVTEAMPADVDEEFGEERLAAVIRHSDATSADLVQDILRAVHAYTRGAPPADDITVVLARREG